MLTVRNLENTLLFYTGILGMEARKQNDRWALFFGKQKINLHTEKSQFQPAAGEPTWGSQDICFAVEEKIEMIAEEITNSGWPIELGPVRRIGALGPINSIYLRDPDGNLIELASYDI